MLAEEMKCQLSLKNRKIDMIYIITGALISGFFICAVFYFVPLEYSRKISVIGALTVVGIFIVLLVLPILKQLHGQQVIKLDAKSVIKVDSISVYDMLVIGSCTALYSEVAPKMGILYSPTNHSLEEIEHWIPKATNLEANESIVWLYHARPISFEESHGVLYAKTEPANGIYFVVLKIEDSVKTIKPKD